ncbi:hillarin [Ditylenchus destructor]|uniref:Hillarin n=1 Tax=Ditylenchus destructor TaxID=166010 RepID=A0AAD4NC62_9BILA|nr:hillarin [Ditylenchus destructor]
MVKELCHRCGKPVYPTDKVGPLKDSTFFHHGCFKCYICGTRLALKTYCNNRNNIDDQEIYCNNHVPNANPHDLPPLTRTDTHKRNGLNGKHSNGDSGLATLESQNGRKRDAGLDDLKIAHAMKATQVSKPYPKIKHEGAKYIVDYDAQTRLELMHRKHEDDLYEKFSEARQRELQEFQQETQEEWEKALTDFARRYEEGNIGKNQEEDIIRQLTIKRDKKLETITSKRKERERLQTAELIDQQAKEMLELFRQARHEKQTDYYEHEETSSCSAPSSYPATPPPPLPPSCSKRHIYTDTSVFEQIDQIAVSVAQSEVTTFTDLIRTLTAGARSDVDKARAIYRWITVKNLNVMVFDNDLDKDTPMGLLRGIKYGTESYHVLFKRLCSYAGLHCMVIKGYSKSAGYQPGIHFEDSRFRNTWNAVFLDGSWRFVQCNWGARHLVNAKEGARAQFVSREGSLRYEYDDHYFCTDPEEFIYEFFPQESEWQLLPRPITLRQFEQLPFVRSLFFRYGLRFTDPKLPAVIRTDLTGAATISISMNNDINLIFHYNLRFYDNDEIDVNGLNLKRFVMQSMMGNTIIFRVHVPSTKPLLLDIFANSVSADHYLTGEPIKFKSVCKFKIICDSLNVIMVPLPECASGEWGPAKAYRLFGLIPITHEDAIINCDQYCELKFKMLKPMAEFVACLHKNGTDDRNLQMCCHTSIRGDEVTINLEFPDEAQYGLDIYTRSATQKNLNGRQLLTHCCKYLINVRVD